MDDIIPAIDKVLQGNKDEFRLITSFCNQRLYRTAYAILKNESDAEDALQTTYLKAYMKLEGFKRESSFMTWVTSILINECKMILRSKKIYEGLDTAEVIRQPSVTNSAMDMLHHKQLRQWLEQAILSLPEKYRLVYMLREINELSTEETAMTLSLGEENVKVRLHRAKSLIRENLLRHVRKHELFPFGDIRCSRLTDRIMEKINLLPAGVGTAN